MVIKTRLMDLVAGDHCVVYGTLFKDLKKRPNVLDEYAKEMDNITDGSEEVITDFHSEKDVLILEDTSGRVVLNGLKSLDFVTGIILAVKGKYNDEGDFEVEKLCTCGMAPQPQRTLTAGNLHHVPFQTSIFNQAIHAGAPARYVMLLSGLQVGNTACDPLLLELLIEYITGHLGSEHVSRFHAVVSEDADHFHSQEQQFGSDLVRVIVAGDSCVLPSTFTDFKTKSSTRLKASEVQGEQDKLAEPMKNLDIVLAQIAAAIPLDLMPGANDPSNHALPQQALHHCLFPTASRYKTFNRVTNPYEADIDGARLVVACFKFFSF